VLITAASHSHWYTSGTLYAAASVIAVVVIGAFTVWATLFAGSIKRRLTYTLADDTPLLARTTALAPTDLEVLYHGQRLGAPRVVSVRLVSRGRRDIGSADFDDHRPLAIDLAVPIVKRLAAEPVPDIPESAIETDGSRLLLGPCRIRKRQAMSFAFLVDGDQPLLTHEDYLLNVDVRQIADSGEPPTGLIMWAMVAALAVLTPGLLFATSDGPVWAAGLSMTAAAAILAAASAVARHRAKGRPTRSVNTRRPGAIQRP
jgi:hypothetical protein